MRPSATASLPSLPWMAIATVGQGPGMEYVCYTEKAPNAWQRRGTPKKNKSMCRCVHQDHHHGCTAAGSMLSS